MQDLPELIPSILMMPRVNIQEGISESTYFVLHGTDMRLPYDVLNSLTAEDREDREAFRSEVVHYFCTIGKKVSQYVSKDYLKQKMQYDIGRLHSLFLKHGFGTEPVS